MAAVAKWRAANPGMEKDANKAWRAAHPQASRNAYRKNRKKTLAALAKSRLDNPGDQAAKLRAWRKANPEKYEAQNRRRDPEQMRSIVRTRRALARGSEGKHTAADVKARYDKQRGVCPGCSASLKPGYHVDHIMPLKLGGSNGPKNIQLLCPFCNMSKNAKHPIDWARSKGLLL